MKWIIACSALAAALLLFTVAVESQMKEMGEADEKPDHVMLNADKMVWGDAPPMLPPGQKAAILYGDPSKEGPYTIRGKVPANYRIGPHTHPGAEFITVLDGSIMMGIGDKWDESKMTKLTAGAFAVMEAGTKHYFLTKEAATVQVSGAGPVDIKYLDPADDPRTKKSED